MQRSTSRDCSAGRPMPQPKSSTPAFGNATLPGAEQDWRRLHVSFPWGRTATRPCLADRWNRPPTGAKQELQRRVVIYNESQFGL